MEKIIITGATGYIGSNLTRRLVSEGHEVHILIRRNSKLSLIEDMLGDINVFVYNEFSNIIDYFNKIKPDVVYHLASLFIAEHKKEDIEKLIDSNLKFSTYILEAMRQSGVKKLINTGTSWQHFNNETYNPVCLYAATKEAFENIIEYYVQSHSFNVITLKLFDTYGPNDNRPKILNLLEKYSKDMTILRMSPGEQVLDLTYIDDIVDGFIIALRQLNNVNDCKHYRYMLSASERHRLRNVIEIYERISGNRILVEWGAREYREREVMIPWTDGIKLPNWSPKYSLEKGLKKMIDLNSHK